MYKTSVLRNDVNLCNESRHVYSNCNIPSSKVSRLYVCIHKIVLHSVFSQPVNVLMIHTELPVARWKGRSLYDSCVTSHTNPLKDDVKEG